MEKKSQPGIREAFRFWLKLGFISFGGPSGQIAIMHTELVEKRRWISEERFLHALNYCMLLPGPEATQLATYIGWLLHRTWGGIMAGALFVLPSVVLLWLLSFVYVTFGNVPWVTGVFYGLKPAVLAIVAHAVIRIGHRALKNELLWAIAAVAFVAIHFFHVPFPIIIASAGVMGFLAELFKKSNLETPLTRPSASVSLDAKRDGVKGNAKEREVVLNDAAEIPEHARPSFARALKICAVWLALWWIPILLVGLVLGREHTIFREGIFFSKAALVTFGGAYAVLPYVAQHAVDVHGWLTAPQMLDGLGLAETTPGPLIMVLQFVGFLGGWNQPGDLPPLAAATLGAFITTWATFIPSFLFIFLGAPHIEQLRGNLKLASALSAVTAAVVGVILNLAVWFGLHVLFPVAGVDWFAAVVSIVAFVGLMKWNWNVVAVVLGAGMLGLLRQLIPS